VRRTAHVAASKASNQTGLSAPPPPPLGAAVAVIDVLDVACAPPLSVTVSCTVTVPAADGVSVTIDPLAELSVAMDEPAVSVHW